MSLAAGPLGELRSLLDQEQPWQSADKLKAIRLLGCYPLDALDGSQVAVVFLACHTIDSCGGELFHEICNGLTPDQLEVARERLAGRRLDGLRPRDQAEAREALVQIIERAVGRLETKAEVHRRLAEIDAATAADRLAFDDSRKGELLHNYEASCRRTLFRTIDKFVKVRQAGNAGKLVHAAVAVESSTEPVAPVEQGITENGPNSATVENTGTKPVVVVEQGITENGPNSVASANTEMAKKKKKKRPSRWRPSNKESRKTNPIP